MSVLLKTSKVSPKKESSRTSLSPSSTTLSLSSSLRCSTRATNQDRKISHSHFSLTKIISIDCERVLTVKGEQVCRVSVVNYFGNVVLDTLIQPSRVVMDYRTDITGIKPQELKNGEDFLTVTMRVRIA